MGNACCRCSCSAQLGQVDYQDIFDKVIQVEDMSHIDELISYIDQLLTAINQGNIPSIACLAKTNRVAASLNSSGGLLEKILKRSEHICKRNIVPKFNRETRKLLIDVTNQAAQIKWVGVALSIVGFVLERIEQVSSNREECIQLLKYMCNLAKYIKQLEDHLDQEKLNRVLQFVVEGSLLCISQMQSHPLSKFFAAPVAAGDLQRLAGQLGHEYSDLTMDSIIALLNRSEEVLSRIPVVLPPSQGRSPQAVGIEKSRTSVTKLLDMESRPVKVVIIYGEGGIGKTTLATAVFSNLDLKPYKYCRIDMEQNCSEAHLKVLQQQILEDLYELKIQLRNLNEGQDVLSEKFKKCSSKPAFIFVDNALQQGDLEKLLPIADLASLPPQSRILVTTRNLSEIRIILQGRVAYSSYKVPPLSQEEARKLLCESALTGGQTNFDHNIDIGGLLRICQGIPLVLNVTGRRLSGHTQNVHACREKVKCLETWLLEGEDRDLSERLVDSVYYRLNASCQEAFLDIVFFYCNWERERVVSSVGATQFEELQSAALVNVTDEGMTSVVNVHDIVKARARTLSKDGERITNLQSLTDALRNEESIKKIKGIALDGSIELDAHTLDLMKSLRVLILTESIRIVNGECKGAFENLMLLSIENHKNYSWMDVSKHRRLSALIFRYDKDSNVPQFAATIPSSLRCLHIERVKLTNLTTTLYQIQYWNSLTLQCCKWFDSLPESINNLVGLEMLNLSSCSRLRSLPNSFGSLSSLKKLHLSSCSSLGSLPNNFSSLSCLENLDLSSCSSLRSLPNNFGSLSCLKKLNLRSCSKLKSLLDSFGSLSCLEKLNLRSCSSMKILPDTFGNLSCLKKLNLTSCSILESLPNNFGSLSCLEKLDLRNCLSLESLPDSFGSLSCLKNLNLSSCSNLGSLPDSFGSLSCLEYLDLTSCSNLVSLPDKFGSLSCLEYLDLSSCFSLRSLPDSFGSLSCLEYLELSSCSSLGSLPDNFGSLSCLKYLDLSSCSNLTSLPDNFGSLSCLEKMNFNSCSSLGSLPDNFGSLSCLKYLDLSSCSSLKSLPDNFGSLSCLGKMNFNSCSSLGSLPNSFGTLSSLKILDLSSCSSLERLPESFSNLDRLLVLHLIRCAQLSLLPECFGNLASLERLELQNCDKLTSLPQNFGQLKSLKYVNIHGCSVLRSLSGDFECLSSLIAMKASKCYQLEENTMEKLAKMKGLMVVDIEKSYKLKEGWEQVKEKCSLVAVDCGGKFFTTEELHPYAVVMDRAFFNSESKLVHIDENGQLGESPSAADGEKLWMLVKESDVPSSTSRWWEAVKNKWIEVVASKGGRMIFVDVGGSWEERERRVVEALPHLPSGTVAWMPPDNRARLSFVYSVQDYYKRHMVRGQSFGVGNCIVSTSVCLDEEGRRRLDLGHLQFILPNPETLPLAESEFENISDQLLSPISDAIEFLLSTYSSMALCSPLSGRRP